MNQFIIKGSFLRDDSAEPQRGLVNLWRFIMEKDDKKRCKTCGCTINVSDWDIGSGFALSETGDITCYACCAESEKEYMIENGRIELYLIWTNNKLEAVNWPGTLRFPITKVRYDVWFDFDGYEWHGVKYGNDSEICHCRKTKRRSNAVGRA